MKIEDASQFLQANAVAGRVRQLIVGSNPKVKTNSRRPTAIALAELRAGKLEVFHPSEAAEQLTPDAEEMSEEDLAAARASFEQMFAEPGGGMFPNRAPEEDPAPEVPDLRELAGVSLAENDDAAVGEAAAEEGGDEAAVAEPEAAAATD